jgi:hypothetical protein
MPPRPPFGGSVPVLGNRPTPCAGVEVTPPSMMVHRKGNFSDRPERKHGGLFTNRRKGWRGRSFASGCGFWFLGFAEFRFAEYCPCNWGIGRLIRIIMTITEHRKASPVTRPRSFRRQRDCRVDRPRRAQAAIAENALYPCRRGAVVAAATIIYDYLCCIVPNSVTNRG